MSHHRPILRFALAGLLAAAALLAADVLGQTAEGLVAGSNQPPRLAVSLCSGELVGHEQVIRQLLSSGTNKFVFVVPAGLRTETAPEGMIALTSGDMSYFVSLRIVTPAPVNPGTREALQEWITSQYAEARSLEEFTTSVADREGTGFQLRQELPKVGSRLVRILWVPFKAGVMEFVLNADTKKAEAGRAAMDMILLTFRSNERGGLEIVARSDKS
jgi:hypothetical protein